MEIASIHGCNLMGLLFLSTFDEFKYIIKRGGYNVTFFITLDLSTISVKAIK